VSVRNFSVAFHSAGQRIHAVQNVSFDIQPGETTALVGESGSGKSTLAHGIIRCLPPSSSLVSGEIIFQDHSRSPLSLTQLSEREMDQIRGRKIAMVFQDPTSALNPLQTIQQQIAEPLIVHEGLKGKILVDRVVSLLEEVGFGQGAQRLNAYPHQLSGGQRQRVMMAMALACNPHLLIADEPTTALDVTLQAEILDRLQVIQAQRGMAILFITHHLGIAAHMAQRALVLKDGKVVEEGLASHIFSTPTHPYTQQLLNSQPSGRPFPLTDQTKPLIDARNFSVSVDSPSTFLGLGGNKIPILKDVSLTVREGETVGLVGESGSGKTTLAFALLRLIEAQGELWMGGQDLLKLKNRQFRPLRRFLQLIFQDPFGSLNPRLSVGQIVLEGLRVHGLSPSVRDEIYRLEKVLEDVGLDPSVQHRYPHEFSGGQRQRIAIARALILRPRLLILDEPTSALDLSIQSTILDLLRDVQRKYGLSYLFISHDLDVVRAMSHRILVMQEGRIVEEGDAHDIFHHPRHPYTQKLIKAATAFDLARKNHKPVS